MNRILKRFWREHRAKTAKNPWVFHKETWGDLEVSVMPRSIDGKVVDSNTGVVVGAPYHGALRACVVVNDGSRLNCDPQALNYTLAGNPNIDWRGDPYCLPRRRPVPEQRNEAWKMAVDAIMQGRGLPREHAEWEADMLLWCGDSVSCGACRLVIPGLGMLELLDQAREYKWRVILPFTHTSWRCPACAYANASEIPSDEELAAMFPEEFAKFPARGMELNGRELIVKPFPEEG